MYDIGHLTFTDYSTFNNIDNFSFLSACDIFHIYIHRYRRIKHHSAYTNRVKAIEIRISTND